MKNIHNDTLLDCWSCAHSQSGTDRTSHFPQLICSLTLKAAGVRCEKFEIDDKGGAEMLNLLGDAKWCMKCGKYKPSQGREKEANSHQHWCAACIEKQRDELPALLKVQAS